MLCTFFDFFGQNTTPITYGKVDIADLEMQIYAKDSTAEAVVLGDYGDYRYYFTDESPKVKYTRHVRIKILKKAGFHWATCKIGHFVGSESKNFEGIYHLKAQTYNVENGIIKTYSLAEKDIFESKVGDNYAYTTFTLPQIREGSVIEYSYEIESGLWYQLNTWEFQRAIPTVESQLEAIIPAYFLYNITLDGLLDLTHKEVEQGTENFLRGSIRDPFIRYKFVMKDVPALKTEPYLTNIENFRSKLAFELAATQFPNQAKRDYSQSWESLNETLLSHDSFGKQLKKFDEAQIIAETLKKTHKDTLQLLKAAYQHIQKTMRWNEQERLFTQYNLDKVYEKRLGNATEINLLLVRLLRECGFEANPFILSTRSNGALSDLVLLDHFNYTVAHVLINQKDLLLDATDQYITEGMLPLRCLNEKGRIVVKKNSRWITIPTTISARKVTMIDMKILPNQQIEGSIKDSYIGYSAADFRRLIAQNGKDDYVLSYGKQHPTQSIKNISLLNVEDLQTMPELSVETTINEAYTMTAERIFLSPMLWEAQQDNPFKVKERNYPVDFGVSKEQLYVAVFEIPAGYIVEEMPKSESIALPSKGGRFDFSVTLIENKLKIDSKLSLKKPIYLREEYFALRAFYSRIVQKHAEQIVLKKAQ
jgi:hypothetical protein